MRVDRIITPGKKRVYNNEHAGLSLPYNTFTAIALIGALER